MPTAKETGSWTFAGRVMPGSIRMDGPIKAPRDTDVVGIFKG